MTDLRHTILEKLLTPKHALLLLQPIYPVTGGSAYAHEAFLRLRQVNGDVLEPAEFIPAATNAGLLDKLDMLTLSQLRSQILPIANRFTGLLAVNIAADSLKSRAYLHTLASPTWTPILPHLLLELPAAAVQRSLPIITYLGRGGIRFSVDLSPQDDLSVMLGRKAISSFKLTITKFTPAQLVAITAAVRARGHTVTITQIENLPQHNVAAAAQPDHVQGFYYGEPQSKPTNAILQALKAQSA